MDGGLSAVRSHAEHGNEGIQGLPFQSAPLNAPALESHELTEWGNPRAADLLAHATGEATTARRRARTPSRAVAMCARCLLSIQLNSSRLGVFLDPLYSLLVSPEDVFDFRRRTIASANSYNIRERDSEYTHFAEVRVLGNDRQLIQTRIVPKLTIGRTIKHHFSNMNRARVYLR